MQPDLDLAVGDRITFRAPTRWSGAKATRVVVAITGGLPQVRYGGWARFVVRRHEIIDINRRDRNDR